jgi:hypothetical protein
MSRPVVLAALAVLALLPACQRVEVREVELAFAERVNASAPDAGSLSGFTCSVPDDGGLTATPLIRRALVPEAGGQSLRMSLVVQTIDVGDNPGCRDTKVLNYCLREAGACAPVPDSALCVELATEPLPSAETRTQRLHALLAELVHSPDAGLSGALYAGAPTDRWVILRAVGSTASCAELAARDYSFPRGSLVGCAFSCPVILSSWSGPLWLDSSATGRCEAQVVDCAGPTFSPLAVDAE